MSEAALPRLASLVDGRSVVVLSGAGCSTESGIPDYRGPEAPERTRSPILYQEFVSDPAARARYWARSAIGWRRVEAARPNPGHRALARLEEAGLVRGVITQNVDGLHQAAGSRKVVELHGSLSRVRCLDCGLGERRSSVQRRLESSNPGWRTDPRGAGDRGRIAPDGDAVLPHGMSEGFRVPACRHCGGVLKPDVVFFGENVPPRRVERAWRLFGQGNVLLVVGSSLTVFSGYRFVERAGERGLPVAIVNLGPTRADGLARVRVEARSGEVLPRLARLLEPTRVDRARGSGSLRPAERRP